MKFEEFDTIKLGTVLYHYKDGEIKQYRAGITHKISQMTEVFNTKDDDDYACISRSKMLNCFHLTKNSLIDHHIFLLESEKEELENELSYFYKHKN